MTCYKYLAMMVDREGMPRAWGTSVIREEAEEEAKRQLDKYCAKKGVSPDDYRLRVIWELIDDDSPQPVGASE